MQFRETFLQCLCGSWLDGLVGMWGRAASHQWTGSRLFVEDRSMEFTLGPSS